MAHAIRVVTAGSGTHFIVNDDVTIAMEVDADGVHLGQSDMPLLEARALWTAPGKIFGLSTHHAIGESANCHPSFHGPLSRSGFRKLKIKCGP